jgi:four helix bundle protein
MKDFRNLQVWHKAHDLTLKIYKATEAFPDREAYGLTSQIRRASVSIPTNIAEGCGRTTDREFARFLEIAVASACEVEYQLLLSHDLHYLQDAVYNTLADSVVEIKRMLATLIKTVRKAADR